MAVVRMYLYPESFICLSTDTLPTDGSVQAGAKAFLYDTGAWSIYDGAAWDNLPGGGGGSGAVTTVDGGDAAFGSKADAAAATDTGAATFMSLFKRLLEKTGEGPSTNPLVVGANVAAAANNQTLVGASGKTTYITGFDVTGLGSTGGSAIKITVTGLLGSAVLTYDYVVPLGAALAGPVLSIRYPEPLPASGQNVSIVVNVPSYGIGNLSASAQAYGFQL